jgi:hypothetical protein
MMASNSFSSPRSTAPLPTLKTRMTASRAADAAVAMTTMIYTLLTGTPTLRAAIADPPEPKIQLPDGVLTRM